MITTTSADAVQYIKERKLKLSLEQFHPDLHDAVRERHKSVAVDKTSTGVGAVFTMGQLYTPEASKKFKDEIIKFRNKHKKKITQLVKRYTEIQAEMSKASKARDQLRNNNYDNYHNRRDAWKNIAKPLGIHSLLTDKGQISKSKLQKLLSKKGEKEARRLLDIYNKQYIPQVNVALKKATSNKKYISDSDSKKLEARNKLVPEANALIKEVALLSAHTCDIRTGKFKEVEGYWGSDYY